MNQQLIAVIFKEILENKHFDEQLIEKYFSQQYIQHVDGKTIDYENFVNHIKTLKSKTSSISISINSMAAEGEIVFSKHTVCTTMLDGSQASIKVIAEFRIKDSKVYYCDELTHMLVGKAKDWDLGSRIR